MRLSRTLVVLAALPVLLFLSLPLGSMSPAFDGPVSASAWTA